MTISQISVQLVQQISTTDFWPKRIFLISVNKANQSNLPSFQSVYPRHPLYSSLQLRQTIHYLAISIAVIYPIILATIMVKITNLLNL